MRFHADPAAAFMDVACVPLDSGHASGTLEDAEKILTAHPEIRSTNIYVAAILGDETGIRRFLGRNAGSATEKGGPRGWDPLTYLCFSRYLRLDRARSNGFVQAAIALLDAGANANTGWFEADHQPKPVWESAIYGAAGIAHQADLTRVLLEHGADPNDEETPYHTPETYDNAALKVLVGSGKLTDDSLATMLLRKADWHDYDGIEWLLEQGVSPNRMTRWGRTALHQAVLRDNDIEIVRVMMDHGADPVLVVARPEHWPAKSSALNAIAIAAWRGRGDVLDLFEARGFPIALRGVERLIAACARGDAASARSIVSEEPQLASELKADQGRLLAPFAGVGNTGGLRVLLDLGLDVGAPFREGDGYFDEAPNSMAIHVAAWRARPETVKLLIERGSPVDVPDGQGRTPLALAVKACVDSYWQERRTPESVEALLRAGASASRVSYPSGYAEVDVLLRSYR